jgi:hypothetical protein
VVEAVRARESADLIARLCDERLAFLKRLRTWPVFGSGWGRRVAEVRRAALAMAKGAQDTGTVSAAPGRGEVPVAKTARKTTTAAVIVAGGAAAQGAHHTGAEWPLVIAFIAVTAILALAGWAFWRWRQRRMQDAPADARVTLPALLRDRLKGWKTMVFGVLVAGSGVAADLLDALQAIDLTPLLPPTYAVKIIAIIGVATILLRLVTTGRVGQKDG